MININNMPNIGRQANNEESRISLKNQTTAQFAK